MHCFPVWARALCIAAAITGMAGCAGREVRSAPPPEVAPQPPEMTALEAVIEGESAMAEAAAHIPPAGVAAGPAAPARGARAERFRPSTLSTREIREQNAHAPRALDFEQRVDRLHDRIYTAGQSMVEATDRRLAPRNKPLKPVPAAPFRLGTALEFVDHRDGIRVALDADFDIALKLPNLEERLRIVITSEELDSSGRSSDEAPLRAGLRYRLWRDLDFDIGIRVDIPPVVFTTVKWQREVWLGSWDFYPLAKLFAETKESFGYALGATFDQWTGRQLLRSSSFAKWRHDIDSTEWSQTFIYARANELIVPDRYGSYIGANDIGRGWGVRALASGQHTDRVDLYETAVFFRGRTAKRWLFWSVEPLVRWERAWNWSADPGIRLGIDVLFWELARPAR